MDTLSREAVVQVSVQHAGAYSLHPCSVFVMQSDTVIRNLSHQGTEAWTVNPCLELVGVNSVLLIRKHERSEKLESALPYARSEGWV